MKQYRELMEHILANGEKNKDRTGKGTIKVPSHRMVFDLSQGVIPIVTGKKTGYKTAIKELLWMIKGDMNLKDILEQNVHIWTEWKFAKWINSGDKYEGNDKYDGPTFPEDWRIRKDTDESFRKVYDEWFKTFEQRVIDGVITDTDLCQYKHMYGYNWKYYPVIDKNGAVVHIDQLSEAINTIKNDPYSRRNIIDTYCKTTVHMADLPSCIHTIQFVVSGDKLHMNVLQRSCDTFLGAPFDITEMSILLFIIANITGLTPGDFTYETHDTHIYLDHIEQVKEYIGREHHELPKIKFNKDVYGMNIRDIAIDDFEIVGYQSGGLIKAPIAI